MKEELINFVIPYIPLIISSILSGIAAFILRKLNSKTEGLNTFKVDVLKRTEELTLKVLEKSSQDNFISKQMEQTSELMEYQKLTLAQSISEYNKRSDELKKLVAKLDKRYVELEAILRKTKED